VNTPHFQLPQAGAHLPPGQVDGHGEGFAVFIQKRDERQHIVIDEVIAGFLPAVLREFLHKVTLVVHKTHRHQGQPQVGGFFQVVAGKDAQTTSVHWQ